MSCPPHIPKGSLEIHQRLVLIREEVRGQEPYQADDKFKA